MKYKTNKVSLGFFSFALLCTMPAFSVHERGSVDSSKNSSSLLAKTVKKLSPKKTGQLKKIQYPLRGYDVKNKNFSFTGKIEETYKGNSLQKIKSYFYGEKNTLIVTKELIFTKDDYAPDFLIQDYRHGAKKHIMLVSPQQRKFHFRYKGSSKRRPFEKLKTLSLKHIGVIDFGLVNYIRKNIALLKKESKVVHYAEIKLQTFIRLKIEYKGKFKYKGRDIFKLSIYPASIALRPLLGDPIYVLIDAKNNLFVKYIGPTGFAGSSPKVIKRGVIERIF